MDHYFYKHLHSFQKILVLLFLYHLAFLFGVFEYLLALRHKFVTHDCGGHPYGYAAANHDSDKDSNYPFHSANVCFLNGNVLTPFFVTHLKLKKICIKTLREFRKL